MIQFYLYQLLMRTQHLIFMLIATIFCMMQPAKAVDSNCLTFSGSACAVCNNVTQLYFGWCWPIDANCQTITESGCAVCKSGFQLLQGWCYSRDPNCAIFSSSGVCTACNLNFIFFQGWCKQLESYCTSNSASVCNSCASGYYLDDGWCYRDSSQINCKTLTPDGCTACNEGYQLAKSECFILDSNCQSLSPSGTCISCKNGFQLSFDWCYKLDTNCQTYNASVCTACKANYNLAVGWCWSNDANCLTSTATNSCILCKPGYYVRYGGCYNPDPNCKILTPSGCLMCIFGYSLSNAYCYSLCQLHDQKGGCIGCSQGYNLIGDLCVPANSSIPCLQFNNKGICILCPSNYTLYNGQCYVSITNCLFYSQSTGGCQVCQQGYSGNGTYCSICSSLNQTSDGSCLSVGGGVTSVNINGSFVPCGPGCLTCSPTGPNQVICITPQKGYSLFQGATTKCLQQTCLTCVPGTSTCKSCFDGYTLVLGNCVACLDPNAIYCSPTNINSSRVCSPKYTIVISNNSVGYCQPCAANCFKCDVSGAGNCEASQCMLGFVQLIGTLNCTACIGSCPVCDANNPNTCLGCGVSRYNDGQGSCLACSSRCLTCTSDTNCSICQSGSTLIDAACYQILGYPCAIMGSKDKCSQCFQGYTLNGSSICVLALASNGTYTNCPYGYYLSNSSCLSCPASNCQACTSNVSCALCVKGYYVKAGVCLPCSSGCRDCFSATSCNQAADGYYLQNGAGSNGGTVSSCTSPCLTCDYSSDYCLTCGDGYDIDGTTCISNSTFTVQIVLGPGSSNTSIFSFSDSNDKQLLLAIKSMNRLSNSFCQILKGILTINDSFCKNVFRVKSLKSGSVIMETQVNANSTADVTATQNSIVNKLTTQGMDGTNVVSANIVTTDTSTSTSPTTSTSNMGLILGVAIGVGVLLIVLVIVIWVIIQKRRQQHALSIAQLMQSGVNIKEGDIQYGYGAGPNPYNPGESDKSNEEDIDDGFQDLAYNKQATTKRPKKIGEKRVKRLQEPQKTANI